VDFHQTRDGVVLTLPDKNNDEVDRVVLLTLGKGK